MQMEWWKDSVIYQIYPRSFCDSNGDGIGDLNGIRSKLDYISSLGVNVIWLSPIYSSPNDDNGYDISDYQQIMTEFGTMEDFDALLNEAHDHGIRVVMDLVVNHTSDEHKWFIESRSSKDNPKRDYYIWRDPKDGKEPNNWGSCFSGSAWEWDETTKMYYLHCFSKKQPDLNWDNPKVREEVFNMMNWWCQKGIDGFRMDVISMISKPDGLPDGSKGEHELYAGCFLTCNGPHVHEYLKEMNREVLSKYDLITVGECAGVTIEEAKKYANADGSELNMVFQFEHMGIDDDEFGKWTKKKMDLVKLKENLSKWQTELSEVAWNSLYLCNHDQPRIVSRLGDDSPQSAKCIATFLHLMQGTPYVYQGEELGMTNYPFTSIDQFRDIESINAFNELTTAGLRKPDELLECISRRSRDNARTPIQWDDSENAGFTSGTPWIAVNPNYKELNAKKEIEDSKSVFRYYQKLIGLRRYSRWEDIIIYGNYKLLAKDDDKVFAYLRTLDNCSLLCVCNVSAETTHFMLGNYINAKEIASLITNDDSVILQDEMELPAWYAGVWEITSQ